MSFAQWEEYLKSYHEQKRLEKYQQERVLYRPKTTKLTIAIYSVLLLVIILGFVIGLFIFSSLDVWLNIVALVIFMIAMLESYGRLLAIKMVECYQHYASNEKRRRCKCVPSCSEYAILCLKKYELVHSLFKIRKRLFITCKGFEYITDLP